MKCRNNNELVVIRIVLLFEDFLRSVYDRKKMDKIVRNFRKLSAMASILFYCEVQQSTIFLTLHVLFPPQFVWPLHNYMTGKFFCHLWLHVHVY